ncbi:oligosaccharide flippase family protein [Mariprofundus aestuarium]|uniref:oligosaccharide flippase family protein n=1 Tax=Mariprofundus aestuarium TaxID=1921086 RepID=UPI0012FD4A85|nr:oligosaccharide flippase family protein [Mariprofundus aestuarium]
MGLKKRFVSGAIWSVALKGAGAVLGLSVYALLARLLTVEDFGTYLLIISLITFMAIVVQAGMGKVALKLVAESLAHANPERAGHVFRATFSSIILVAMCTAVLWGLVLNDFVSLKAFHSDQMASLGWWSASWFVLLGFIQYFSDVFRGEQSFFRASLFQGTATSIITVTIFGCYYFLGKQIDLYIAVQTTLFATLIIAIIASGLLHRRFSLIGSIDLVPQSKLWPVAWPIFIASVSVFVSNQADLWILGMLASKDEVALYGAALRTVLLITIAPLIVNSVIQPMIVELYTKGEKQSLQRLLGATATATLVPSILLLIAVILAGDEMLAFVFGEQYAGGALIFTILCAGRTIAVFSGSCGQCLMLGGHQKALMLTSILFVTMSIVVALLLVEKYGSLGVAIAFSAGTALQNLTQAILVKQRMGVSTFASTAYLREKFLHNKKASDK